MKLFGGGGWGLLFVAHIGLQAAEPVFPVTSEHDFDRDGVAERLISQPGRDEIQLRKPGGGTWEKADFALPEGVFRFDEAGRDAGLRFVDLNGDGFGDVLFSNPSRFAVHLWNKDVKPHLGWTKGWSQFVRAGERRGAPGEPPSVAGALVRVERGELVVERQAVGTTAAGANRYPTKALIAFDMPPPKSPDEALAAFRARPGFRVELVAAEPVVIDPIAFDWGADGRFWVVEMRDYPLGLDGQGQPGGVVKQLVDADGDGRFERAITFLEGVSFPSSVMAWRKGVLVATAPDLIYAEDTDGDGRADRREVWFTGFEPGNQQHRINGFEWGFDGWIYAANGDSGGRVRPGDGRPAREVLSISGRDVRFRPDTGDFETVSAQTQYGRRRDDWGNWFGNNNPTWLWHVTLPEHYLRRNPQVAAKRVLHVLANYEDSTRVFPASAAMVRPNQPWSLNHVTSGSSASPYRDDLFGPDFTTSVFICEPVHNVVHREVLEREGAGFRSQRAPDERQSEFLASTDNWFRPTNVRTGPDGALYVADMYRFVLEHPEWISPEMLARLDLRAGTDRGRIYRVAPEGAPRRGVPNLARLTGPELVAALDSPSGWQRDRVQQLLLERREPVARDGLVKLLTPAQAPQVRLQALATLGLLGGLAVNHVETALADPHAWVRCEALRQSEGLAPGSRAPAPAGSSEAADLERLFRAVAALATDGDAAVRLQAAFSLGAWPAALAEPVLRSLAAREDADDLLLTAVRSSLGAESALFAELKESTPLPRANATPVVLPPTSPDRAVVIATYAGLDRLVPNAAHGRELFQALCLPCHRLRGEGHEVGPDLGMVGIKPDEWLLVAILDPGQVVEARYRGWSVTLESGDVLDGLVATETSNNLVIRMAGGLEHAILRGDIASLEPLKTSLMPGGFESALRPQDMADLLRWLRGP